jgi:hypothetical protein
MCCHELGKPQLLWDRIATIRNCWEPRCQASIAETEKDIKEWSWVAVIWDAPQTELRPKQSDSAIDSTLDSHSAEVVEFSTLWAEYAAAPCK